MLSIATAAFLSFFSALIVAVVGHLFSLKRQRRTELAAMQLKAYTDFINAVSRLVAARRKGITEDDLSDLTSLNDAKARICICADKEVVKTLSEFWQTGGTLESEREIIAFTRFCYKMRKSLGMDDSDIVDLNISNILFKLEPSNYSFRTSNAKNEL